jgi:nucleoside-diphosphate-sugar epimerase
VLPRCCSPNFLFIVCLHYLAHSQDDAGNPNCAEGSPYRAAPDSEYGWEELFSARQHFSFQRSCSLRVHVARSHNVFGPEETWRGVHEKAPTAMCRKAAEAEDAGTIKTLGDASHSRSFLHIDEALDGVTLHIAVKLRREGQNRILGDGQLQRA